MIRFAFIVIASAFLAVCGGPIHQPDPWEELEGPPHEDQIRAWWGAQGIDGYSPPIVEFWCHGLGLAPFYNTDWRRICMVNQEGSWVFMFPRAQMRMAHEATMAHEFGEHVYAQYVQSDDDPEDHDYYADCFAGAYWGATHGRKSARWVGFMVWRQIAVVLEEPDRRRVQPWMLGAQRGLEACHPFFED